MISSPQISIVMPSYQQVAFLEEAVRSVLDQDGVEVELLVMDPGSTDGSRELLLSLQEFYGGRLKLHFSPDDGQADAINRGMAMASGTVLGWLNSDDRLRPGALRQLTPYLSRPASSWVYGRCGIIDEQGRQIAPYILWYKNFRGRRFSMHKFLTEDFIPQMATFWNRSMWDQAGGLDKTHYLAMDYDLFLRFAKISDPVTLKSYLADFRIHRQAKSSLKVKEHLQEAYSIVRIHARGTGWRGRLALVLHQVYAVRTRIIYWLTKP